MTCHLMLCWWTDTNVFRYLTRILLHKVLLMFCHVTLTMAPWRAKANPLPKPGRMMQFSGEMPGKLVASPGGSMRSSLGLHPPKRWPTTLLHWSTWQLTGLQSVSCHKLCQSAFLGKRLGLSKVKVQRLEKSWVTILCRDLCPQIPSWSQTSRTRHTHAAAQWDNETQCERRCNPLVTSVHLWSPTFVHLLICGVWPVFAQTAQDWKFKTSTMKSFGERTCMIFSSLSNQLSF